VAVIAVIQQKGGVGKSTITANLAAELIHAKRRVVLTRVTATPYCFDRRFEKSADRIRRVERSRG
jgi:anion-transporting  ArsA/GET3 family ATPase